MDASAEVFSAEGNEALLEAGQQVVPVYPAKSPMKPADFQKLIPRALAALEARESGSDPLPPLALEGLGLPCWMQVAK
jgi:hypothetical protein